MRVANKSLERLGFKNVAATMAATSDQYPSVARSVGVGLLVWFITRWLDGRFR